MTGTEKLPLLLIGKSANPRCFKGVKTLPIEYKNNKKAWMTSALFEEWIRKLDRKMAASKRNILLIIDNCTAHPAIGNLKAIKLEFLPPNVTAILQPLDQGVIHCFKSNYRKMLVRRMIAAMENKKTYDIDILGAMHLAKSAWNDVPQNTIAHCFRHAGFKTKEEFQKELGNQSAEFRPLPEPLSPDAPVDETPDTNEMTQLLSVKFPDHQLSFDEYVVVDENLQCCEENLNEE
ncbi:tigger transposable element-derived protein 4-like [Uloborus diversus]|uniref:tigger transposable element-derived protein 4-like n=1 Tax=Uloborus diversus TaxID=327109 RepID=UPI002409C233|nr:tigger transposable element-derived protein 4-like [Uloborus diversus]